MSLSQRVARLFLPTTVGLAFSVGIAHAAVLHPTSLSVTVPTNSTDTTSPYKDDVFLDSMVFSGVTFSASSQIAAVSQIEVLTGRKNINSEWGDTDNAADGDDNPFAKAGFDPADQETTDPLIQDPALLQTFNTLSLSEMSDGEGGSGFSFRAAFSKSLTDNNAGADLIPELVFFERGLNDNFSIRLITGGNFANPVFSKWVDTSSRQFFNTGVKVDTKEIKSAQSIGVGGFDLTTFGLGANDRAYGFELKAPNGSGPDLNGFFLTAEDSGSFGAPIAPVPLPAGVFLMLGSLAFLGGFARRDRSA